MGDDGNGKYLIFGPGAHRIRSPFYNIGDHDVSIMTPVIMHGTWTIVTVRRRKQLREEQFDCIVNPSNVLILKVPQGQIGLAIDRGQPVLLPPGLHQWDSQTLKYEKGIDLCQHVIELGPYTLLTVDEG